MTHIKKTLSFILILSILISAIFVQFSFNVSAATRKGTVVADVLRIRSLPNTKTGKILGEVKSGATVQINSEKEGETVTDGTSSSLWFNITYNEITGWVSSIYINEIPQYEYNQSFETQIEAFPENYKPYLRELHAQYPNWQFLADKVKNTFSDAVSQQLGMKKQVQLKYHPVSWRSMGKGAYDWTTGEWIDQNGGWTGASKEVIQYYMDPRNFLNSSEIYMFLMQSYGNATYTEAELKSIVTGSFLYTDEYIKIILKAGKESGVSPYIIASKILQEQGRDGTLPLVSGNYTGAGGIYKGYYNFFNWKASGSTNTAVIENGLKYAKNCGWNTKEKSIVGGATQLAQNYINVGQDTYYHQDFDVHGDGSHQYAQAVHDARNKGVLLQKHYANKNNITLVFRIPYFEGMPDTAVAKPVENNTQNNYYFDNISVSGLTPSFYRYTYNYDLRVTGDTIIDVTIPDTAYINCALEYALVAGNNTVVLKVRSQSGYDNDYTINVNANQNCTLYINKGNANVFGETETAPVKVKGDINNDGKITVSDMATIRLHLLGKYTISGDIFDVADINGDGKITVSDMATVRLHLLGKYTIK